MLLICEAQVYAQFLEVPFPLGPIGAKARAAQGESLLVITEVDPGGPGASAGLSVGDGIYAAQGHLLSEMGQRYESSWIGAVTELSQAIIQAQSGNGLLNISVLRSGVGKVDLNLSLPLRSAWNVSYPIGDSRSSSYYETLCLELHQHIKTNIPRPRGNGYWEGYLGMILLAHPEWDTRTGSFDYGNSIDTLLNDCINRLNSAILEPVEEDDPSFVKPGTENWALVTSAMFVAEYRRKSGDTSVDVVIQRASELLANRIQTKNPMKMGHMGHGGVVNDYGNNSLNIINSHTMVAMSMLRAAGADFNVFSGTSGYSIEEKVQLCWSFLKACMNSQGDKADGNVGYAGITNNSWDSSGRTAGAAAGYSLYLNAGGIPANTDDLNKLDRMKAYCVRRWDLMQYAHGFGSAGVSLNMMLMPFIDERSRRHFMENNQFYFTLTQNHDEAMQYFPLRAVSDGTDKREDAIYIPGLAYAVMSGNLPSFPAVSDNRIYITMDSHADTWPELDCRQVTVNDLYQVLDMTVLDHNSETIASGYSATWSQVSGGNVTFSTTSKEDTSVTFPAVGTYRLQLDVSKGALTTSEVYEFIVGQDPVTVSAPSIIRQPRSRISSPGSNVDLSLEMTGDGPFYYEWQKDGVSLWGASLYPNLRLTNVAKQAEGNYVCLVHHPEGVIVSDNVTVTIAATPTLTVGGLRREVWYDIGGNRIADLTANDRFPTFPDVTEMVTSIETPSNSGDRYGEKMEGWLIPPTTGQYRFYVASDDHAELWLSTDDAEANKVLIVNKTGFNGYRSYSDGEQSGLISLTAGQKYYIEVYHKESGAGDHLAVAWQLPGGALPANGSEPIGDAYLECLIDQPDPVYHGFQAWWPMDEGYGDFTQDMLGGADGYIQGASWVVGRDQSGLSFDGNDMVRCGNSASVEGASPFTVSAWIRVNTGHASKAVILQQHGPSIYNVNGSLGHFSLTVNGNGTVGFELFGKRRNTQFNFSGMTKVNDGQWHHVLAKRDDQGNASIWVDGVQDGSVTGTIVRDLDERIGIAIGGDQRYNNQYFHGAIDEVRLYNRDLGESEIAELSQLGMDQTPRLDDVTLSIDEAALVGSRVGAVSVSHSDAGDDQSYAITAGNDGEVFAIHPTTGEISTAGGLNFEAVSSYSLRVRVTDAVGFIETAVVTVNVTDVDESGLNGVAAWEEEVNAGTASTHKLSQRLAGSTTAILDMSGLSGSATYEFVVGAEDLNQPVLHLLDNSVWSLRFEQWSRSGRLGVTRYGESDYQLRAVSGASTASPYGGVHHLVYVVDSENSETRVYIDGELVGHIGEVALIKTSDTVIGDNRMGSGPCSGVHVFAAYNDVLEHSEIIAHYNAWAGPTDTDGDGVNDFIECELGTDPYGTGSTPGSHFIGLVGWWRMNEAMGTSLANDSSGNAHHGVVTGATVDIGAHDKAREFSGSGQYIDLGNPIGMDVIGEVTMSAWIKAESVGDYHNILAHGHTFSPNGEVMLRIFDGKYQVGSWNGSGDRATGGDAHADLGTWVNITGVYDGTHWRLYKNGVEIGNVASSQGAVSVSANWAIGARGGGINRFFDGIIDEVYLYGRALSEEEVAALYEESIPDVAVVETGLVSNIGMSEADISFDIVDTGGAATSVTLHYGDSDGGSTRAKWQHSVTLGAKFQGAHEVYVTGLDDGVDYYYTIEASNIAGSTWGSVGSFSTLADPSPKMVRTIVNGVSSGNWTAVDLGRNYNSAVIVATPIYANAAQVPVVTRIRNVSGSSFEVKLDRADGLTAAVSCDVSVIAVEEGVYTLAGDGVQMEAVKFTSTISGENNNWVAEARPYANSYTTPVVLGQVMSANDTNWSVFWSMGSGPTHPADTTNLNIGKHVAEDSNNTRADETIGYIIIESGEGVINGVAYSAGVGSDTVRNFSNNANGYEYGLSGLYTASAGVLSSAGMDGYDGCWPVFFGDESIMADAVTLIVDEDAIQDSERTHTTEQVSYLIFE
ncbi:LamG-like jellyroll fold domain-containing protein [Rubritalea tangerina]|uniref:LamG-like jellyroll fold domain-containing protein n=1 Tax=Rubritalea tangerina TaxID=430798 RepID=UPI003610A5B0